MEEAEKKREIEREMKINNAAAKLSRALEQYDLDRLKLACSGVGLKEDMRLEELDDQFTSLFNRLKRIFSSSDIAVVFCCQVLQRLGYNAIESFRQTATPDCSYDYQINHPKVDCILTVLEFVSNLSKLDFSNARSYVCEYTKQASDRVKSRVELVNVLFNEGLVSEDNLDFVLHLAKMYNRSRMFNEYRTRRKNAPKLGK